MDRLLPACLLVLAMGMPLKSLAQWTGEGEFGLLISRGNSETESLNAGLELQYERDRWSNESGFRFFRSEDADQTTANRWTVTNNTNYTLHERSYLVGALRYDRDRFSSFRFQTSGSLGYGRRIIKTPRHTWNLEAGPGVRYSEQRDSGDTETDLILRAFSDYSWQLSETSTFSNETLIEAGDSTTFVENATVLDVAINSKVSLRTGFTVRHNTEVESDRDKTDYLTTVNLAYSF